MSFFSKKPLFKKVISLFFISFLPIAAYSQNGYRDPFESLLPEEKIQLIDEPRTEGYLQPPAVSITGILWGSNSPKAIIDGEVYKVGDTLETTGAKVFRIEKNVVFIFFKDKIYEMGIEKHR